MPIASFTTFPNLPMQLRSRPDRRTKNDRHAQNSRLPIPRGNPGLTWFSIIYVAGVLAGIAIALSGAFEPEYLLFEGLGHLCILVAWGYFVIPNAVKKEAGDRIQTAGYLHTLIGFSAAIVNLESAAGSGGFSDILYPLGSALSTSIVGWLLGGEISSMGADYEKVFVRSEFDKLAYELATVSENLRHVHSDYVTTIQQSSQAYKELQAQQESLVNRHQELQQALMQRNEANAEELADASSKMSQFLTQTSARLESLDALFARTVNDLKAVEPMIGSFSELQEKSDLASINLSEVAKAAKRTAQYLNESKALISELETLLDYVVTTKAKYES